MDTNPHTHDHTSPAPACPDCGDPLAHGGACLNVGACFTADRMASRAASGDTVKAPAAWTISGGVD